MDIKDLEPIITLMTQQEERLIKKVNELHDDVKETKDDVKKINGRLRHVEGEVICIDKELDDIRPSAPIIKHINLFMKHPKKIVFVFIMTILGVQILVMAAIEHKWVSTLINFIKP